MQDLFACRECHAIYAITRLRQPPALPPFCRNCGCKLPPAELGDWLAYERAEPEWSVDAWLRGSPQVRNDVYLADRPEKDSPATELASKGLELRVDPPAARMRN
jgi:hypothetical protein